MESPIKTTQAGLHGFGRGNARNPVVRSAEIAKIKIGAAGRRKIPLALP
jgi:hypothetical protein